SPEIPRVVTVLICVATKGNHQAFTREISKMQQRVTAKRLPCDPRMHSRVVQTSHIFYSQLYVGVLPRLLKLSLNEFGSRLLALRSQALQQTKKRAPVAAVPFEFRAENLLSFRMIS